jgi:hypothetical protein
MAYQKNRAQTEQLIALSKEVNLPVRELMLADEHIDRVCTIFYAGLPKLARMTMRPDKFKAFFQKQRQAIADDMFPQK